VRTYVGGVSPGVVEVGGTGLGARSFSAFSRAAFVATTSQSIPCYCWVTTGRPAEGPDRLDP
jgi:hypothetical protein